MPLFKGGVILAAVCGVFCCIQHLHNVDARMADFSCTVKPQGHGVIVHLWEHDTASNRVLKTYMMRQKCMSEGDLFFVHLTSSFEHHTICCLQTTVSRVLWTDHPPPRGPRFCRH